VHIRSGVPIVSASTALPVVVLRVGGRKRKWQTGTHLCSWVEMLVLLKDTFYTFGDIQTHDPMVTCLALLTILYGSPFDFSCHLIKWFAWQWNWDAGISEFFRYTDCFDCMFGSDDAARIVLECVAVPVLEGPCCLCQSATDVSKKLPYAFAIAHWALCVSPGLVILQLLIERYGITRPSDSNFSSNLKHGRGEFPLLFSNDPLIKGVL
jgi:hypothetical protein